MNPRTTPKTLDPADWGPVRKLTHRAVDDMLAYVANAREKAAWQPIPEATREHFRQPVPRRRQSEESVYREFIEYVLPYPLGNLHPRFWGWVSGSGSAHGMLADFLASSMNSSLNGFQQAPELVEQQVLDWIKELMGFPKTASAVMVSSGSLANFVGLAAARNAKASGDVNVAGLAGEPSPMTHYCSVETHSSMKKGLQLLGVGTKFLRLIPVDQDYQIDLHALRHAIEKDARAGLRPAVLIGTAGTTDQGAFDDLDSLADIASEHGMWLHVDGAFGATVMISDRLRVMAKGLERADSLALDFHKWFYIPYGVACTLVRDEAAHRNPFTVKAGYLSKLKRGVSATEFRFADYSPELSREFMALKVWMCFKTFGLEKLSKLIEQNVDQAAYLAKLIRVTPELELITPVRLNVVCFRFIASGLDEEALNDLNACIVMALQEQRIAVPSHTMNKNRLVIRVAICNHRSVDNDFDVLVQETVRLGEELSLTEEIGNAESG